MSANNGLVVPNYYLYRSEMWRSKRYVWIRRLASRIIINQWDYTRVTDREEIRSSVFCNFNKLRQYHIARDCIRNFLIRLCTLYARVDHNLIEHPARCLLFFFLTEYIMLGTK